MTNIRKVSFGFSLGISSVAKGPEIHSYSFLEHREHLLPSKVFQLRKWEKHCNSFKISSLLLQQWVQRVGCYKSPARRTCMRDQLLPDFSIFLTKCLLEIRPWRYCKGLQICVSFFVPLVSGILWNLRFLSHSAFRRLLLVYVRNKKCVIWCHGVASRFSRT